MGTIENVVNLREEMKDDVLIFHIKGRLDALSAPIAEKKIFDAINEGRIKLLFEFSGVTYLSSAGMRMLLSIIKKLRTLSGHLILCSVTHNIMDVLKMSGFDHLLELSKSQTDALSQF